MRTCNRCNIPKDVTEFNKRSNRKDGLQPYCRECQHKQFKKYYHDNRASHRAYVKEQREENTRKNREFIVEHLKTHPCVDCGCSDLRVLEYDHLDSTKKHAGVMQIARQGSSLDLVIKEMDKCEVRCRNCHTIKTYERMGGSWHDNFMEVKLQ